MFDYVDPHVPMLGRMFEKRLKRYRAIGYEMESDDRIVVENVDARNQSGEFSTFPRSTTPTLSTLIRAVHCTWDRSALPRIQHTRHDFSAENKRFGRGGAI